MDLLTIVEVIFPITNGIMETQRAQHAAQHKTPKIFLIKAGPRSYESILIGFRENSILPTGAGKLGELFGSVLASPILAFLASDIGINLKSSLILTGSSYPGYEVSSQNESLSNHPLSPPLIKSSTTIGLPCSSTASGLAFALA
jgi:hypothetical protein